MCVYSACGHIIRAKAALQQWCCGWVLWGARGYASCECGARTEEEKHAWFMLRAPPPLPLSLFFFSLFCRRASANTINSLWFTFMCLCIVDENVHTPQSGAGPPQHSHNVLALCDVAVVRVEGPAVVWSRPDASHALQKLKRTQTVNFTAFCWSFCTNANMCPLLFFWKLESATSNGFEASDLFNFIFNQNMLQRRTNCQKNLKIYIF